MIRTIYLCSFLLISTLISAQNIVYNGGMESIEKQLPCHWKSLAMMEQNSTYQWFAPQEKIGKYVSRPFTSTHKQGDVQAMLMFRAENSAYMVVELKRTLSKGEEVNISLETIGSYMQNGEGLDEIGVLLLPFSPTRAADLDNYKTNDVVHLRSLAFPKLDSRDKWMSVESNFIAKGGEQFLIIGNFKGANFAMISRNKSVGNWYQSSAATGNSKGWFGFIFDNVAITSVLHKEADAAYNNMSNCGYEMLPSVSNVSPKTEVLNANKPTQVPNKTSSLQAGVKSEKGPNVSAQEITFASENEMTSKGKTASNIYRTTPQVGESNAQFAYIGTTNVATPATNASERKALVHSNSVASTTRATVDTTTTSEKKITVTNQIVEMRANPPANETPETSATQHTNAATTSLSATTYYSPSVVAVKVDMQAEVIFFENAKANLSEKAFILLDNMAKKMAKNPRLLLQINGYANESKEQSFAYLRANAVQAYLRSKGIDKARLIIKPVGNAYISHFPTQTGKVDFIWIEK